MNRCSAGFFCVPTILLGFATWLGANEPRELPGLEQRFANPAEPTDEVPDFQRHVSPLLGRLGCNGRACHGSFQGRGGFRLSLFGYDFKADHDALLDQAAGRVDPSNPDRSLVLTKPVDADQHEGGKRFDSDSWQQRVLRSWIAAGAPAAATTPQKLEQLILSPAEILLTDDAAPVQLRAVAVWSDGTREDVTQLCRFQSNDSSLADVNESGLVVQGESRGDSHIVVSYDNAVVPVAVIRPVSELLGEHFPATPAGSEIDQFVLEKLSRVGILPSEVCDDATFIRRVSLDLSATLPTPERVRLFLESQDPDKRARLVDELLESPGYNGWWATKLCDWTGNNPSQMRNVLPNPNAGELWYEWIYRRVAENLPYDRIVEGIVMAESRNAGESYLEFCEAMSEACRNPERYGDRDGLALFWTRMNFRTTEDRAIGFAYAFLGIRIQCAQCHKHPFDQWTQTDFEGFEKLFGQVQYNGNNVEMRAAPESDRQQLKEMMSSLAVESLKGNDLRRKLGEELRSGKTVPFNQLTIRANAGRGANRRPGQAQPPATGKLLGGDTVPLNKDTRAALMKWLRSSSNPYFAKAFVNRVWAHYFSVGIVDPPDDLNLANPPSNAPLLEHLTSGFIASGFDMKWLHRTIVLSDTYQRSSVPNATNLHDRRNFSHYLPRRLPAETVHDAMLFATSSQEKMAKLASSREGRTVALGDPTSQRGRNADAAYALNVFGRSTRESNCDCDRSDEPSLLQTVFLRNDRSVHQALIARDSWVIETCKKLNVPTADLAQAGSNASQTPRANSPQRNPSPRERLERQRQQLTQQVRRLSENPDQQERVAQLKEQLEKVQASLAQLGADGATTQDATAEPGTSGVNPAALTQVVQEAYLRTLSRLPEETETERSRDFIRNSPSIAAGIEGLLWALINTKEFSLNH
jgi:hypothetical protein